MAPLTSLHAGLSATALAIAVPTPMDEEEEEEEDDGRPGAALGSAATNGMWAR